METKALLSISIKALQDGKHPVQLSAKASMLDGMFPEFTGEVVVHGTVQKLGKRYILQVHAACDAALVCDLSGEQFIERVEPELTLSYVANTHLFLEQIHDADPVQPYYIREDDTAIDITDEVRQELAVNLPLKRVAPQYRDKNLGDIFPEFDADAGELRSTPNETQEIDPRWAALGNISFQ